MPPLTIQDAFALAVQIHQAGRLAEAEQLCRQILVNQPSHADALHLLGVIAMQSGRTELAGHLIHQAIAVAPGNALYHWNLASLLQTQGQLDQAIDRYQQALAVKPEFPEAYYNLAQVWVSKRRMDDAIPCFLKALALRPDWVEAHNNLGNAWMRQGKLDEAIACYERAMSLSPGFTLAHCNLAYALIAKGQLDEAIAACRRIIALQPDFALAHCNLGMALRENGQLEEAIVACRQAIALDPDMPEPHFYLSGLLLATGEYAVGWEEFEWRYLVNRPAVLNRDFRQPRWDGADVPSQTLLIHAEGGFGDALSHIRLVPLARRHAGKVIVECQPEILRLFDGFAGVDQWMARGQELPPFDCQISMLSLPKVLGIRPDTIPNSVPYLKVTHELVEYWRTRIPRNGTRNIGICWAGSPRGPLELRTQTLGIFSPLASVPGIQWFSLQKGPEEEQSPPQGMSLVDHTRSLQDFTDTAALIDNLDLVISVDTAMAHLAGALGKPVWVLLPAYSNFPWLHDGTNSPWYPTMRLFRQTSRGDWSGVIANMAEALAAFCRDQPAG